MHFKYIMCNLNIYIFNLTLKIKFEFDQSKFIENLHFFEFLTIMMN